MKTFETEKGNIPEGATHYFEETENEKFAWWDENKALLLCPGNSGSWESPYGADDISNPIPIPQTNIETPEEKDSEWGGEGLPPAGVECEFSCEGFWGDSDYHWCRFLGLLSDKSYAIEFHHPTSPSRVTCQCFDPQCTSFRKPETEAERVERELEAKKAKEVNDMCFAVTSLRLSQAVALYDAGYRKES